MVTHGTGKVASLVRTILSVPPAGPLPRKIDDIGLPLIFKSNLHDATGKRTAGVTTLNGRVTTVDI